MAYSRPLDSKHSLVLDGALAAALEILQILSNLPICDVLTRFSDRRMAYGRPVEIKHSILRDGALAAALKLLQEEDDATLCADLSFILYETGNSPEGLEVICTDKSIQTLVGLSQHHHEPTRASAVRLIGLVVARGGAEWVLEQGGTVCLCVRFVVHFLVPPS